jgi:hypothetical protein
MRVDAAQESRGVRRVDLEKILRNSLSKVNSASFHPM